jgi:hypothetical protein
MKALNPPSFWKKVDLAYNNPDGNHGLKVLIGIDVLSTISFMGCYNPCKSSNNCIFKSDESISGARSRTSTILPCKSL